MSLIINQTDPVNPTASASSTDSAHNLPNFSLPLSRSDGSVCNILWQNCVLLVADTYADAYIYRLIIQPRTHNKTTQIKPNQP